jgi:acyl-CoA synthetase (AMP-forming)/AMP-acid ligase II
MADEAKTVAQILQRHYQHHPEREVLVLQHAGKPDTPLTYRQLFRGAVGYARALQAGGIRPGEVVVLILQHGLELVYAFYGAILYGAIPSIMPFLTEKLLPERYRASLASLVSITQPAAILTYEEFAPEVKAAQQPGSSVVPPACRRAWHSRTGRCSTSWRATARPSAWKKRTWWSVGCRCTTIWA